ncbi:MAG: LytR/AlgR family response regulator transcription factor [Syntrophomonadaceae bacterium]|jgi:two-component system response regulator LytT
MTLRVLIADDNERERIVLRYLLEQMKDVEIVGEAVHGLEALLLCQEKKVDLVFLDITMPEMGGVETANRLCAMKDPPLFAFVTVHAESAVQAYDLGALDYIVKPIEPGRIDKTILRARERLLHQDVIKELVQVKLRERLEYVLEKYREDESIFNRLPVRSRGRIALLDQRDIIYCESQAKKVSICTRDKLYMSSFTLSELAAKLNEKTFFRAHPAFIVNLNYVKEILSFGEGSYILRLHNSERDIILSRSKAKLLRQKLGI